MLRELARQHTKLIVLEEASEAGSLGSAVLEFYAKAEIQEALVRLMGIPDLFVEHGSIKEQRAEVGLTIEDVCLKLRKWAAEPAYGMGQSV